MADPMVTIAKQKDEEIARLRAERDGAVPFVRLLASVADEFDMRAVKNPEEWAIWSMQTNVPGAENKQITVADCRAARAFLATLEGE